MGNLTALDRATPTIASLRTVAVHGDRQTIYVIDENAIFKFVPSNASADDGVSFVRPNNVPSYELGRWIRSISGTGGSGAPVGASYLVVGVDATLTNERALSFGGEFSVGDAGPGGNFSVALAAGSIVEAKLLLSDSVIGDVSIAQHGFAPKLPNDATKYLDGTGAYSVPAGGGGGGPDANAFHKNGDSFGANVSLGTNDNKTLALEANNVTYLKLTPYVSGAPAGGSRSAGDIGNLLLGSMSILPVIGAEESGLQYGRNDTAATFLLYCSQDGSQGQGYGESAVEVLNNAGKSTIITAVGDAFAGTSFGYNTASQGRLRSSCDVLIAGTSSDADFAFISHNLVRAVYKNDGKFRYGGDLSALGSENFTIRADAATTGTHYFQHATTGVIIAGSKVGVGTSPSAGVHIKGTSGQGTLYIDESGAGNAAQIYMGNLGGSDIMNMYALNGDHTFNQEWAGSGVWKMKTVGNVELQLGANNAIKARVLGDGTFAPLSDNTGSLGKSGLRWSDVYAATTHIGDLNLDNEEKDSHWTLREATQADEDPDTLYAINRRTFPFRKYKVQLVAA